MRLAEKRPAPLPLPLLHPSEGVWLLCLRRVHALLPCFALAFSFCFCSHVDLGRPRATVSPLCCPSPPPGRSLFNSEQKPPHSKKFLKLTLSSVVLFLSFFTARFILPVRLSSSEKSEARFVSTSNFVVWFPERLVSSPASRKEVPSPWPPQRVQAESLRFSRMSRSDLVNEETPWLYEHRFCPGLRPSSPVAYPTFWEVIQP